jgi:hypothetical protein
MGCIFDLFGTVDSQLRNAADVPIFFDGAHSAPQLSLFLGRLGGLAAGCLRGRCWICALAGAADCGGLGETDGEIQPISAWHEPA